MRKLNYKTMIIPTLMAFLCLQLFACSSKDNTGEAEKPKEGTLVKPKYNRNSVIRNPLNGWVMYAARDANESYWDKEIYVADLGKRVKVIDYASACYLRTSWSSLNPSDGVYTWRDPNTQIGRLIKGAKDRGLPIGLRIVVDGRDQGMNTPKFVFDAGAKSYLENSNYPTRITPIPQDPVFQQYYAKFIEELAKDFNDPARTSFIDAYGLGKWGEAHNVVYEDPNTSTGQNTERLKEEVFDWITDLYSRTFTKVPLVINYHRVIGDPVSWGSANPNSDRLLVKAINKGYSLRQDAFGMNGYYGSWEKQFANNWIFKRPIIMEGGWIISSHSYWTDPSGKYRQGHPEDVRQGEFDASAEAHVNMMDFRAGSETVSWFENSFTLVQRFISEGGYRLYPDRIYLPEKIKSGAETTLSHRWRNMGWGYFPNNIPQWNYRYKVAFALLDAQNNVKKVFVDKDSEPSTWLKDTPVSYDFKTTVDLPAGAYSWAVAIVDTSKDNQPAIKLAVNGDITNDGWVKLLDLQVQ
ncbi:DUF4832 domain-containing protein [Pararcticibacter amylolyticus]|uniref:DUF4832 domain-containing protein n=1 Tax=Pararcticibacter amylolyticus TaxID=2173175 RepID=A0A2U2PHP6_9SPHI|nr:DUF4832 domain-containing protein [Pararcticibacter amylolyticus]PWG80933.1 DUF4832 domain-containing protein [Pararcticibacter amylolyticus]